MKAVIYSYFYYRRGWWISIFIIFEFGYSFSQTVFNPKNITDNGIEELLMQITVNNKKNR
jgi:hypothetical protein